MKALRAWLRERPRSELVGLALLAVSVGVLSGLAIEAVAVASLEDALARAPIRFYARPLVFQPGQRPDRVLVEEELRRLGYVRASAAAVGMGEYRLAANRWTIGRRPFRHHEGLSPGGVTAIQLAHDGRITEIEGEGGRNLELAALEPELIGYFSRTSGKDQVPVSLTDVPGPLVDAVLSIEDRRFFEHGGLDLRRIAAASLANLKAGEFVQGGSTLTQQLVRSLYLSPRRTLLRKAREVVMALALEARYTKEQILEAYLNEVYLGQDGGLAIHGVGRAAQYYFGKDVSALGLAESATLAGLIRGPGLYSPWRRPAAARERRDLVLRLMWERGVISESAYLEARGQQIKLAERREPAADARYFLDYVGKQLRPRLGADALESGGLAVFTTLDLRLQRIAEQAVRRGLAGLEDRLPRSGRAGPPVQVALVAIDPQSGDILAMVGGRDYGESQFNRAVDARRQPGSAFKPIVALAALARRASPDSADERPFTLATVLHDERLALQTPQGMWEPTNYDGDFRGPVSLRDALEHSLNVPFARLGLAIGPGRIAETARRLGIEARLHAVPSIALGSSEVTPLDLTRAYGVLAAGGYRARTRATVVALDRGGAAVELEARGGVQVYDPAEAYLVTSALRGAVERGTGRGLRALGFRGAVAAKSGTTNDYRDAWFIGYTPALTVGVWVGFDDGRSLGLPGSRAALPIFADFLIAAVGADGLRGPYGGGAGFPVPDGIEFADVDPQTGLRAGPGCPGGPELFLEGTAPLESCSPYWWVVGDWPGGERWSRERLLRLRRQLLGELGRRLRLEGGRRR